MFRRCMWNFFKVENEHLKNISSLKAVEDIEQLTIEIDYAPSKLWETEFNYSMNMTAAIFYTQKCFICNVCGTDLSASRY